MPRQILAIGGGENGRPGTNYETEPFDQEIIQMSGKADPSFLFVSLANPGADGNYDSYYQVMQTIYQGRFGLTHTDHLNQADIQNPKIAQRKIDAADIIYVGGGNTLKMMNALRRTGTDKLLDAAYQRGAVLCGVSAGAICWCAWGNSDSRSFTSGSSQLIRVRGLGYLPVLLCPHYDAEPLRQTDLPRMMRTTYGMPAIALDNGAALEVLDEERFRILTSLPGAKARACYWKDGEFKLRTLPITSNFLPIRELLRRE